MIPAMLVLDNFSEFRLVIIPLDTIPFSHHEHRRRQKSLNLAEIRYYIDNPR